MEIAVIADLTVLGKKMDVMEPKLSLFVTMIAEILILKKSMLLEVADMHHMNFSSMMEERASQGL